MAIEQTFSVISLDALLQEAGRRNGDGWRYIQTLAVNTDAGIDLVYSFMKDGRIDNLKIVGVQKGDVVPSITGMFLAAFVFENEIRELFGVNVVDIAIDFNGSFYDLTAPEPMTIVSPEQKAAKEKAAKVRAAMAAKAAKAAKEAAAAAAQAAGQEGGAR